MNAQMSPGQIIMAQTASGFITAALLEDQKRRILVMALPEGSRQTWALDRIIHISPVRLGGAQSSWLSQLLAFDSARLALQPSILLADLWEVMSLDPQPMALQDIALLALGEDQPPSLAALAVSLHTDDIYFRKTKQQLWQPNSFEAVEAAQIRQQRQAQEEELIAQEAGLLKGALENPSDNPPTTKAIDWLIALAISDPLQPATSQEAKRAEALLTALTKGSPSPQQAFELLVQLGVFSPDEPLALRRNQIVASFAPHILTQAEAFSQAPIPPRPEIVGAVAIDDPWTRDIDDALLLEKYNDTSILHILIADIAARVPIDSPLSAEARQRGGAIYLPTETIPMFPGVLTQQALSREKSQPALDFRFVFQGTLLEEITIHPVSLRLAHQISYDEADRRITQPTQDPLDHMLTALYTLARHLDTQRAMMGAIRVDRPETIVRVHGDTIQLTRLPATSPSRLLVSEMMILACTQAGQFAIQNNIPLVYRRQSPPENLDEADMLPVGSNARIYRLIRSLKRAELSSQPALHFALGVEGYTQVTAPLRRYQDYLAHVQLRTFIETGRPRFDSNALLSLFAGLEERTSMNTAVERQIRRYWLLKALQQREGQEVTGEIVATMGSRAIVHLEETDLQLTLPGAGHIPLATSVNVRVLEVNPRANRAILAL